MRHLTNWASSSHEKFKLLEFVHIPETEYVNYVMFIPKRLTNCRLFVFAILRRIVLESHCFQGLRICLSNIPT